MSPHVAPNYPLVQEYLNRLANQNPHSQSGQITTQDTLSHKLLNVSLVKLRTALQVIDVRALRVD